MGTSMNSTRCRRSRTLFGQVQAGIAAEKQLRYLAEHDDLTGLPNRRALVAYLDDRLMAAAGPVVGVIPRLGSAQGGQ